MKRFGFVLSAALTLVPALARAAAPAEIWPAQPTPIADPNVPGTAMASLAPILAPAIKFEESFLRIVAGAPTGEWSPPMRAFAASTAADPVSAGVRELAKVWLARAEIEEIAKALDQYYAVNVRYPASLSAVEKSIPADLRRDPWGEAWVYNTHAPKGFANQEGQRYQIGSKRFPDLGTIREATGGRKGITPPAWKVALQVVGSNRALEFRQNGAVVGVIAAGGKIDGYSLLYVGEGWALMAATDQLFTVNF